MEDGELTEIIGILHSNRVLKVQLEEQRMMKESILEHLGILNEKEFCIWDYILNEAAYIVCDG